MNKHTTIRAVAQRTGKTYFEVQVILEALIETWSEALAQGDHIAIQDFLSIRVTEIKTHRRGKLRHHNPNTPIRKVAYRVNVRMSQKLREQLHRKPKHKLL